MHTPDRFCTPVCDKTVFDALVDLAYDIHFSLEQEVVDLIDASLYRVFHGYYNILYFAVLSSVKYILKGLEWQRFGVGEILQSRHFTISSSLTLKGNLRCHVVIVVLLLLIVVLLLLLHSTCLLCVSGGTFPC